MSSFIDYDLVTLEYLVRCHQHGLQGGSFTKERAKRMMDDHERICHRNIKAVPEK